MSHNSRYHLHVPPEIWENILSFKEEKQLWSFIIQQRLGDVGSDMAFVLCKEKELAHHVILYCHKKRPQIRNGVRVRPCVVVSRYTGDGRQQRMEWHYFAGLTNETWSNTSSDASKSAVFTVDYDVPMNN